MKSWSPADAFTALCLLAILALLIYFLWPSNFRTYYRKFRAANWDRTYQKAQLWKAMYDRHIQSPGSHVAYISKVYQKARRGVKALMVWRQDYLAPACGPALIGWNQDTWFWWSYPCKKTWVLVMGSHGYGPHNQNPDTFYVGSENDPYCSALVWTAPKRAPQAWVKCAKTAFINPYRDFTATTDNRVGYPIPAPTGLQQHSRVPDQGEPPTR